MSDAPIFRFAPSPNGPLHEGHAFSARLNREMADRLNGRFLIRMEDIDTTRCTRELGERALRDLAAINIVSDGPVWWQSERTDVYREAMERLKAKGLVYPARLSRAAIRDRVNVASDAWPHDPDGAPHYPTDERDAWRTGTASPPDGPVAWRLDLERAVERIDRPLTWIEVGSTGEERTQVQAKLEPWGDPILWRKDDTPAYHLAVVVDDAAQEVTHVVRGLDLRDATSVHRVLQGLLGLTQPLYHHHPLVTDGDGKKLSKSAPSMAGIDRDWKLDPLTSGRSKET